MRKNRILLYLASFLQGLVFYGSIATLYRQSRGLGLLEIGVIESISLVLVLVLELPWGYIANRIGYKKTLLLANLAFFLSKIIFWRAYSFGAFLWERVFLSVAVAGLSGCDTGFLYENTEGPGTIAFSLFEGSATAGLLLASLSWSLFLQGDYSMAALLTAAAYGLSVITTLFLEEPSSQQQGKGGTLSVQMLRPLLGRLFRLVPYLLAAMLLAETSQFVTVFLSPLFLLQSGIPLSAMGFIHCLLTLCGLCSLFSHKLSCLLGEWRLQGLLFLLAAGSGLLLLVQRPFAALPAILLLRACASVFAPLRLEVQNRHITEGNRPLVLSLHSMVTSLASVPVYLGYGRVAEAGLNGGALLALSACLAGLLLLLYYRLRLPNKSRVS